MKKRKLSKKIQDFSIYALIRFVRSFSKLFTYKFTLKSFSNLGYFIGMKLGYRKETTISQLKQAFPKKSESEIYEIAIKVYRNLGMMLAEVIFLPSKKVMEKIEIHNWENLLEMMNLKRSGILATAHFGNWENSAKLIAYKGIPCSGVAFKQHNEFMNNLIHDIRTEYDSEVIYKQNALRKIIKSFKNKRLLGLLIDQDARKNGIKINFLNKIASAYTGPAKFVLKYKIPLIFGYSRRDENNILHIHFDKMILPEKLPEDLKNINSLTLHLNKKLEEIIRKYPENWFWVHKRWKKGHLGKDVGLT